MEYNYLTKAVVVDRYDIELVEGWRNDHPGEEPNSLMSILEYEYKTENDPECHMAMQALQNANILVIDGKISDLPPGTFERSGLKFKSIVIQNGIPYLRAGVFAGVTCDEISIPESVTVIEPGAFNDFTCPEIRFSDKVCIVCSGAFSDSHIDKIILPGSVAMGLNTFIRSDIKELELGDVHGIESTPSWNAERRELGSISSKIHRLPDGMCFNCPNLKSVTMTTPTEAIGMSAFQGCVNLTSLDVSKVKDFGDRCLCQCQSMLFKKTDFDNVKNIGQDVFAETHFENPKIYYSLMDIAKVTEENRKAKETEENNTKMIIDFLTSGYIAEISNEDVQKKYPACNCWPTAVDRFFECRENTDRNECYHVLNMWQQTNPKINACMIYDGLPYRADKDYSDDQLEEYTKKLKEYYQKGQEEFGDEHLLQWKKYVNMDVNNSDSNGILLEMTLRADKDLDRPYASDMIYKDLTNPELKDIPYGASNILTMMAEVSPKKDKLENVLETIANEENSRGRMAEERFGTVTPSGPADEKESPNP